MKRLLILLAAASMMATASAQTFNTNYVSGLQKSFEIADGDQTEINVTAGLAFDPTSQTNGIYNRVYLANRSDNNDKRGLYSVDIVSEISSSRLALAGNDSDKNIRKPGNVAVDSSGNAYVAYGYAPMVWKVVDPSGAATEIQMLGNYRFSGDDDPGGLVMVPTGFGGGFEAGVDLVLTDPGADNNETEAISIMRATSTPESPDTKTLWADVSSVRGETSDVDGYAYFSNVELGKDWLGGVARAYINRMDSAGTPERVFLDIDPVSVAQLDDTIAINPTDGSLWMVFDDNGTRKVYRVDVVNAVATNTDYLASLTLEIADLGHNVGKNCMDFSPDGKQLAFASPDDQDQMILYTVSTSSPHAAFNKIFYTTDTNQTTISTSGGIAFDPSSQTGGDYDRVYLVNRTSDEAKRGLYSIDLINETSSRVALSSLESPSDVAVDAAGVAYVSYAYAPSVWKVSNLEGVPVETKMLGGYGGSDDDDIDSIAMVPSGFGGSYAAGSDLVVFDGGLNLNGAQAISVLGATSTAATPVMNTIWEFAYNNSSLRTAASDFDGYIYFARWDIETADLGGTTRAYINRLDSSGNIRRVFLDIDPALVPKLDDAVTVNPIDGSFWMNIEASDTSRDVFRVDVANAVATNEDFLAEITFGIENLGFNVGSYAMTFSPDGKQLAIGCPDAVDKMYVYDTVITIAPYNNWVVTYGLNGSDAQETADPDGDGLSNLYEYGLGGDPTNSADLGISPSYAMEEGGGVSWMTYVYPKRLDSGLSYYLEINDDLVYGDWLNSGYSVVGTGSIDAGFDAVTNQVSSEIKDEQFIRLIIK